jgi:hypothetical protein
LRLQKRPAFPGNLTFRLGLHIPVLDACRARRCQITGSTLQYSQIWETRTGDWFDLGLPGRGGLSALAEVLARVERNTALSPTRDLGLLGGRGQDADIRLFDGWEPTGGWLNLEHDQATGASKGPWQLRASGSC